MYRTIPLVILSPIPTFQPSLMIPIFVIGNLVEAGDKHLCPYKSEYDRYEVYPLSKYVQS